MAKGPGTVGRTGRVKDGPQVVDIPLGGVTVRTGRGSGKGIIAGVPKKKQPRPDLIWHSEDEPGGREQVKLSERVRVPQQGTRAKAYQESLENLEKVHTVKKATNPTQMSSQRISGAYGTHQYITFIEDPSEENGNQVVERTYSNIEIDFGSAGTDARARSTIYHEQGHSYDSQQINYRDDVVIPNDRYRDQFHRRRFQSENAFRRVQESGTTEFAPGDSPWDRWAKSVMRSKAYQRAKKERGEGVLDESHERMDYWNRPRELFARTYQQYMGETVDPESLKDAKKSAGKNQFWSKKDFQEIGMSLEDIFISRNEFVPERSFFRPGANADNRIIGNWTRRTDK